MAPTSVQTAATKRNFVIVAITVVLALSGAHRARTQLQPLGPDFQVNAYTTGEQGAPRVVAAPDGSFTVVWDGGEPPPGDSVGWLVGRRFDAQGQPLGGEFPVSESVRGIHPGSGTTPKGISSWSGARATPAARAA